MAGAELGTHFMAKAMAKKGHEVHVVITRPLLPRVKEVRDGYTIHWLNYFNIKGFRFFSELRAAMKTLLEIKPDLVHGNCLLPGGYVAAQYAKRYNCASILLCYGYDVSDMSRIQSYFGKKALREVDMACAASHFVEGKMKHWVDSREYKIFYAGFDDENIPHQPLFQHQESYQLLFIGRMIPEKGFDFLLKVMQVLPEKYQLSVIGKGDLFEDYKEQVESTNLNKRVSFLGTILNQNIKNYLQKSHALVLPSRREPFGVVCIEAIASGVPVVCSNVMGLPEAVQNGDNGYVLDPNDINAWASSIQNVCESESLRQSIYENSKVYRKKWQWSTRCDELERLYRDLTLKKAHE